MRRLTRFSSIGQETGRSESGLGFRKKLQTLLVCGSLALVGAGCTNKNVTNDHVQPDNGGSPDFIFGGNIDDHKATVVGAVRLRCSERGVKSAAVMAEAQVVTTRHNKENNRPPRGRVIEVRVVPGVDECEGAISQVLDDPTAVIDGVVKNVQGFGPKIFEDGSLRLAEKFQANIDAAQFDVPQHGIPQ